MQISRLFVPLLVVAVSASHATAASFDTYGAAPADLVHAEPSAGIIVELGLGVGATPAYEGASDYTTTISPIVQIEKLTIPGLIDISEPTGGLTISPSMDFIDERKSEDHDWLAGLNDVDATFIPGVRVGYEMGLAEGLSGEIYGKVQYAFGGAEDFLGSAGANLFWHLTPQLTVSGGPEVSFAGDDYMNTYFGVTSAESTATGGRLAAYDPEGGMKSASINVSLKYEFVQDTFITLSATYRQLLDSAADSPIVEEDGQFLVSAGLSRKFTLGY